MSVAPSNSNIDVTPSQLCPFPTAQRSSSAKKKTAVKAQVVTASPYKNQLMAQQAVRQSKPKQSKRCAKSLQFSPPAKNGKDSHKYPNLIESIIHHAYSAKLRTVTQMYSGFCARTVVSGCVQLVQVPQ
jgi:hypothetical protein